MSQIKKSKDVLNVLTNDYDTLGFVLRWISSVLAILWGFFIITGIIAMYIYDMWSWWWALAVPCFLFLVQSRLAWKYRMFKPSDMLTQQQIEEKLKNG